MVGAAVIIALIALFYPQLPASFLLIAVVLTVGTLACLYLLERGRVQLSAIGSLFFIWFLITSLSWMTGGLTSFSIINYILVIVAAGLLLGSWGVLATALISLLTTGALMWLQQTDMLPVLRLGSSMMGTWMLVGLHILFVSLLLLFSDRALRKARKRADEELRERQRVEGELAASERRFRLMVENVSEPILLLDGDAQVLYVSPAGERMPGPVMADGSYRTNLDFVHADDRQRVAQLFNDLAGKPDAVVQDEVRFLTEDGQWRWVDITATNKLEDPDLAAIVVNYNDVTQRKEDEEYSRQRAARNHELAELSHLLAGINQDYHSLVETISRRVGQLLNCGCSMTLLSEDGQWLDYAASYNPDPEVQEIWQEILRSERQRADEGIMGQVLQEGEAILVPEVDPYAFLAATKPEFRPYLEDHVYQTFLVVPLRARGAVIGTLGLSRQPPGPAFTSLDMDFAYDLADRAALAIANTRLYNELQEELVEREQAEVALQRSQETLAKAQQIGNIGSYVFDLDTRQMRLSEQLYRMIGVEPNEQPVDDEFTQSFLHPEDREAVRENTRMAIKNGYSAIENRVVASDGHVLQVHTTASTLYDDDGNPISLLGTVQDITARKQVEIDLQQRETILEAVAIAAQGIMYASDWDENIHTLLRLLGERTRVSQAYFYQVGVNSEGHEVANLRLHWMDPERGGERCTSLFQQVDVRAEGLSRWRGAMLDGEPYYGLKNEFPNEEADLLMIGDIQSFIHVPIFIGEKWHGMIGFDDCQSEHAWSPAEIDALKVAASLIGAAVQNQRASHAQRESARLVRALGDNLPGGAIYQMISYPDERRRFTYISGGVQALSGLSPGQIMEEASLLYERIHLEDRDKFVELEDHSRTSLEVFDTEARMVGPDDELTWCRFRAALRVGSSGAVIWDGLIQDISVQKDAEDAIRAMNLELEGRVNDRTVELETANRELMAFSYSVSHDLRAPLRAIDGYSSLLVEEFADQLDAEAQTYIENIRVATQRMGDLIMDLLKFSRLARIELKRRKVDMSALAEEVFDGLQEEQPERQVSWHIEEDMSVHADKSLLQVVLENLLGNAWKFTSKVEHPHIEFGEKNEDQCQVFYVKDNGAGFDMKYADRIFEPFERLHAPYEFEGTGIGLATVKRILQRHGGEIWAEAAPNAGATFYFRL
jgi:PAS domain S-box-containing protein